MLFKLSWRGARRQLGNYAIYFITMVMATAMMSAYYNLSNSKEIQTLSTMFEALGAMAIFTNVVIAGILSWLVGYIISFMLKKRSREFGTYLLMGLEKKQIISIFFMENIVIGGIALVFGILLGGLFFQVLRALMLHLFGQEFVLRFSFSLLSVVETLLSLVFMYGLALWRSRRKIKKMQIYRLLYVEKENEQLTVGKNGKNVKRSFWRRLFLTLFIGAVGVILLLQLNPLMLPGAILLIISLYGFFINLAAGMPGFFNKHPVTKYTGTNLLVFRSLSAKLLTMGITVATISVLFAGTLAAEGSGIQFEYKFRRDASLTAQFDFFVANALPQANFSPYRTQLEETLGVRKELAYQLYEGDGDELLSYMDQEVGIRNPWGYQKDVFLKLSDYTMLREMLGYSPIQLKPGEYLVHSVDGLEQKIGTYKQDIPLGEAVLRPGGIYTEPLNQYPYGDNGSGYVIVVEDSLLADHKVVNYVYVAMTEEPMNRDTLTELEQIREQMVENVQGNPEMVDYYDNFHSPIYDQESRSLNLGLLVFPLYYLAMIFTMVAMTILTIQLLSESDRYKRTFDLLDKLGQSKQDRLQVLRRIQIYYYGIPLIPALVVAIAFLIAFSGLFDYVVFVSSLNVAGVIGITVGIFFVLYFLYVAVAAVTFKKNVL